MSYGDDVFKITIRKRKWWFWALASLWLTMEILLVQTAIASVRESENRAATISWITAAVVAAFGILAWLRMGNSRLPHVPRTIL